MGQIIPVIAVWHPADERLEFGHRNKPSAKGGFLRAADLDALSFLDGAHVLRCVAEAVACPRVEPGESPAETNHAQLTALKILDVHVSDFQLASGRGPHSPGNAHHLVVVNVKAGNR